MGRNGVKGSSQRPSCLIMLWWESQAAKGVERIGAILVLLQELVEREKESLEGMVEGDQGGWWRL